MELKNKTFSGFLWSFTEQIGNKVIQFVIGIILARILLPAEFGLIGMIAIFIAISGTIANGGFVQALIRKQNCTNIDYNTAFIFNFVSALSIYGLLFLSAPFISDFYNEPELTRIIQVLCLIIPIDSLSFVQRAKLYKDVNFKKIAKVSILSQVTSGVVGIFAAVNGYGVWSLVIRMLLNRGLMAISLMIVNKWLPNFSFSKDSFKELFRFGSKLLITQIIERIYRNIYFVIIGKVFSVSDLGYYTRANQFKSLVSEQLVSSVQRVTLPILSTIQDDSKKLQDGFLKLISLVFFISAFLLIGLLIVSEPMILFLIGEKWRQSIVYLQLLSISAILYPIGEINLNILQVKGRSDYILKLQIIKRIVSIPLIIIGVYMGINYLIYGIIVSSIFDFFANSYYSKQLIHISSFQQLRNSLPSFMIMVITAIITYFIGLYISDKSPVIIFFIQLSFYVVANLVVFEVLKKHEYIEIKNLIINSLSKYSRNK